MEHLSSMDPTGLLKELAVVLALASLLSAVLRRLNLPGALGYLLAGWLAGPFGPFHGLVASDSLSGMAELGVVLLFFTMGAEFHPGRLKEAGLGALLAATSGILTLVGAGSLVGRLFGWAPIDCLFLGSLLAISSTVMVARTLKEGGHLHKPFARLTQAILVAEDILAVALLAILAGAASGRGTSALSIAATFGKMGAFLAIAGGIGLLILPRMLGWLVRAAGEEALLLGSLALAFGFCILMESVGFSAALGAFLAGALLAGSPLAHSLANRIEPLRDLFSALFFISMGLLINPVMIGQNLSLVLCGALLVLFLKPIACLAGALVGGKSARVALRSGLSLGQIGEFSLVIASLGASLKVTRPELHAVAIGVTLVTSVASPFLLSRYKGLTIFTERFTPRVVRLGITSYLDWSNGKSGVSWRRMGMQMVRKLSLQIAMNSAMVGGLFFAGSFLTLTPEIHRHPTWLWALLLTASLPFLVAIYRKLRALGMVLGEISFPVSQGKRGERPRKIMTETVPVLGMGPLYLWIVALSGRIAPPLPIQLVAAAIATALCIWLWKPLTQLQSRIRAAWADALGK
jgi:monovalent cation:H+ antiporter-2, CPA2 family